MSTLLEQASLVMIPSGYKEDVVYSQIPTDGAGDLSFTRASNGTRINSAGLVEVCPWNLVQQSEALSVSPWGIADVTITDNAQTAPNGTSTADVLTEGTGTAQHRIYQTTSLSGFSSGIYTLSAYVKNITGTRQAYIDLGPVTGFFNFASETTYSASGIASFEKLSDGWYRFSLTSSSAITPSTIYVGLGQSGSETYTGNGTSAIAFWGAQLNIGSTAKPYFPTTDRLNVPRLTYQNGGGGCPSLLLEKQSTNLVTYSEQFDNAVYTKTNVSVTANTATSPDGTQNADTITSSAASPQLVSPAVSFASSTNVSLFVKYVSQKYVQLFSGGAFGDYVNFDIESGAVGSNGGTTTNAKIENFGNGWYRISATFGGYTGTTTGRIAFVDSLTAGWNSLTTTTNKSIYAWGFQIEASSYGTSYIPSTSSSATRVADVCGKTSATSLIGQTEGTIFLDFVAKGLPAVDQYFLNLSDGSTGNLIYIGFYSNILVARIIDNYNLVVNINVSLSTNTRYKVAFAYKANDCILYINGTNSGSDTSATIPATSVISLNDFGNNGTYEANEAIVSKTRLSNAELASLTTI